MYFRSRTETRCLSSFLYTRLGRWNGREAFVRIAMPMSFPMKLYIWRCRALRREGFGTYLSMEWMPLMPETKPSCSALRFGQGTRRGMWAMCSSFTMSDSDSRYGPPASIEPSPINETFQTLSFPRSCLGGNEWSLAKIWPKMDRSSTLSDWDLEPCWKPALWRLIEMSRLTEAVRWVLSRALFQISSLVAMKMRGQQSHRAAPRLPEVTASRRSIRGMVEFSIPFRCCTSSNRNSRTLVFLLPSRG
mmetsp:Transcript_31317/g.42404  ORF Transcript_31317/g.42404 Transcript_31317/m.42404 type:complete len:247 (+) Transcript_31317:1000-1740(+)